MNFHNILNAYSNYLSPFFESLSTLKIHPSFDEYSGLAIIDACHLADCLKDETQTDLEKKMQTYDMKRQNKLQRLHHISNIAQMFGHVENEGVCNFRNSVMTTPLVPRSLKGYAFDRFIQLVAA